jgi:uncharacterized membrane protein
LLSSKANVIQHACLAGNVIEIPEMAHFNADGARGLPLSIAALRVWFLSMTSVACSPHVIVVFLKKRAPLLTSRWQRAADRT